MMGGAWILAVAFFASGAMMISTAKRDPTGATRGKAAMPATRKKGLGIVMLVLGGLVTAYWLIELLGPG
jgi:hypothetical protein